MNNLEMQALKCNPRAEIIQALREHDLTFCLFKTAGIHGHFCPGSALGVMAAAWGLEQLEEQGYGALSSEGMEDLMAIVETNACFADGVQVVSGCTFGNNALVYRDIGKLAVSFALRGVKKGVRIRVRNDFWTIINKLVPQFYPAMKKVIMERNGNAEEEAGFKRHGIEAAFALMKKPFEQLLISEEIDPQLPEYAPITESMICPDCNEQVMGTKIVPRESLPGLCRMCSRAAYFQVDGQGIVPGPVFNK